MYQHRIPASGTARPESHFESAQEANDIYDLYGRESIYGYGYSGSSSNNHSGASGHWDESPSPGHFVQGLPPVNGAAANNGNGNNGWGAQSGGLHGGASNPNGLRRYPSPLRFDGGQNDDLEELDEEVGLAYDHDGDNSSNTAAGGALDFSRPSSREPDFARRSDYDSYAPANGNAHADHLHPQHHQQRWSHTDECSDSESDYNSSSHHSSIGGLASVATITLATTHTVMSNTLVPTLATPAPTPHAEKARAAGLSPIALGGPAFAPSEAGTHDSRDMSMSVSGDRSDAGSAPPTPRSAVPPHIRTDRAITPDPSGSNSNNSLSPTNSNSTSPVHPSIARIYSGARSLSSDSSKSGPMSGVNSNASLVSSQYPGEDPDAYHVRSTYARLDVEGVFGDGWDEGVERTRGGASNTGTRMTMVFPSKDQAMTDQERAFISSLDRYGFVDTPTRSRSEGRLALVPAAPFGKVPKLQVRSSLGAPSRPTTPNPQVSKPNAPPPPSPQVPNESRSEPTLKARRKEEERVIKWMKMMSVGKRDSGRNIISWRWSSNGEGAKHPTRIYKGIPDRWRMAAWWTLAEDQAAKAGRTPSVESLEADYTVRRDGPSESDVQIDLDVPRTISGHALFRTRFGHGQRALFHVLHAFSQACATCGYCQGMGSIAATLLCYYEPERAYTLLVRLHDLYDMHGIFAPGFPGLLETFYVQERLIECLMPDVYESFQRNMISSSAWGAKIYITLFVNVVPFNVQLRIWDAMFLDGFNVMVMAVLALLWAYRPLLAAPGATFESILSLLSSYYVPEDEDAMLQWMRKMLWTSGTRERIAFWRREWRGFVERGEEGDKLL